MSAIGRKKIRELRSFMEENSIDLVLIKDEANARYFSSFFGASVIAIDMTKRILFVSPIDFERAEKQADVEEILNIKDFSNNYENAISKTFKGCKKVGIVKSSFSLSFFERLKKRLKASFVDLENFLIELRSVKLEEEISLIKKSCKITNFGISIIQELLEDIKGGRKISEKELAFILEKELIERGAEKPSFETIVASGLRSFFPHPHPPSSNNLIKNYGMIDFGSVYKGYCSDVTVPFVIGCVKEKQRLIIEALKEAYKIATYSVKINKPTWEVYKEVEDFINSRGYELKHALGHGLGLTVHDYPSISPKPKDKIQLKEWKEVKFKEKMIFTIEPGIYSSNTGFRLENDFILKKDGMKQITNSFFLEI
ncbi:MAG: Xaa-Pro peptidase family protein [Candidatus Aenigmatarchaeota archaeon]